MRSILRLSTFLAVLVFASIHPLLTPQAQGTGTPQCFGLSAADCKILTAADANLSKEMSFQYDYEFTMSFAGSLTSFASRQSIVVQGHGVSTLAPLPQNPTDPTAIPDALQLTLSAKGTSTTGTSTEKVDTSLIIVDGILYSKNAGDDTWNTQSLSDLVAQS